MKNYKVAVLGLGYIGTNLLKYLQSLNIEVIGITIENINILENDEFDFLINSSGNSGDFREQIFETIESNISLNSYILKNAKIRYSYVYISSSRVYGFLDNDNTVFNEEFVNCYNNLNLDFIYDGSKKLAESLLFNYSKKINYNIAILRLSNVYGRFNCLDDSTMIKKVVRYKKESLDDLTFKINRYSKKDYIYIDDVVHNIVHIMLNIKKTDVYNLCYGKSYSLDDIANIMNLKIKTDETVKAIYSNLSNIKIKKDFSIKLNYDLEDGLNNIIFER